MTTMTKEIQEQMTPEEALNQLQDGNRRFVENQIERPDLSEQVVQLLQDSIPLPLFWAVLTPGRLRNFYSTRA